MLPEILVGQGVLHGIQNDGTPLGLGARYGTFVLSKVSGAHVFDMKTLKDETDFDAAMAAVNEGAEIEIDFTISSGVGGNRSQAAALAIFPAPLEKTTLTGNKLQGSFATSATKLFDGDFLYIGGAKLDESQNDFVKLTGLKLKKYADPNQNASMTTTVVG